MKRKKIRKLVAEILDARASIVGDRPVYLRTLGVDFERRTIRVDDRVIQIDKDVAGFTMPLLSGDAVFIPRAGMERIG